MGTRRSTLRRSPSKPFMSCVHYLLCLFSSSSSQALLPAGRATHPRQRALRLPGCGKRAAFTPPAFNLPLRAATAWFDNSWHHLPAGSALPATTYVALPGGGGGGAYRIRFRLENAPGRRQTLTLWRIHTHTLHPPHSTPPPLTGCLLHTATPTPACRPALPHHLCAPLPYRLHAPCVLRAGGVPGFCWNGALFSSGLDILIVSDSCFCSNSYLPVVDKT